MIRLVVCRVPVGETLDVDDEDQGGFEFVSASIGTIERAPVVLTVWRKPGRVASGMTPADLQRELDWHEGCAKITRSESAESKPPFCPMCGEVMVWFPAVGRAGRWKCVGSVCAGVKGSILAAAHDRKGQKR